MSESQTPILYHYLASPYSEKLRLALGVTGIQWGSVIVPAQPPRPSLDIFLSGYRRIPVLQIGAHFYCDSALAFDALAGVSDRLKPAGPLSKADELLRRHAEDRIFFAVIAAASPISVLRLLAQDLGLFGLFRFLKDRSGMMKGSTVEKLSQRAAARIVEDFVMQLNGLLKQDQFLGGAHAGYLDLCCYHPLWMASVINRETLSALPPMVQAWMRRIAALGHGRSVLVSERQIYDRVTGDRFQDFVGELSGAFARDSLVSVRPTDYARDSTEGHLVFMDEHQCVIKRNLPSGDAVFLHFPISGFEVRAL
ncbi:glutathione S-transferase family protein [Luminiphilus sp.]|nr:glutathione S-transferase family protein [Luminiphilus sp.]